MLSLVCTNYYNTTNIYSLNTVLIVPYIHIGTVPASFSHLTELQELDLTSNSFFSGYEAEILGRSR